MLLLSKLGKTRLLTPGPNSGPHTAALKRFAAVRWTGWIGKACSGGPGMSLPVIPDLQVVPLPLSRADL